MSQGVEAMSGDARQYRTRLLRVMYAWTILVAGAFGVAMLIAPEAVKTRYGTTCDPVVYGIAGSVFLAFALLAALGFREPVRYSPVLLLQLVYKVAWILAVAVPLALRGQYPATEYQTAAIFMLTVVGDFIALPYGYLAAKSPVTLASAVRKDQG